MENDYYHYAELILEELKNHILNYFNITKKNVLIKLDFNENKEQLGTFTFRYKRYQRQYMASPSTSNATVRFFSTGTTSSTINWSWASSTISNISGYYPYNNYNDNSTIIMSSMPAISYYETIEVSDETITLFMKSIYKCSYGLTSFIRELVHVLSHEIYHLKQLEEDKNSFKDYIRADDDLEGYFNQKAEIDANEQAKIYIKDNDLFIDGLLNKVFEGRKKTQNG